MNERTEERLLELLSDKAVFGLNETEAAELAALDKEFGAYDDESFELAAAAIAMVGLDDEPLPTHLRAKIAAGAEAHYAAGVAVTESKPAAVPEAAPAETEYQKTFGFEPQKSSWSWLGWAVAAFACVALAVNVYIGRSGGGPVATASPTPTAAPAKKDATPSEARESLLASAGDLMKSEWGDLDPKKPYNVKGDVVWSQTAQKGYIRFTNLPVNDKTKEQYQLWIFDADQKYPVDGGVFDADKNGEIVVAIDPKIKVSKPTMFAVTVEKPGGVVVSDKGKVLVVAKVNA